MIRSWAYNRFGVLMGTSSRASCPRWPSLRGNSWPMITLFSSQGDFCATAGSLFDYVDRHYNHGEDTYPLAHNPVTSHYVSGPVRFPVDLRVYRRYEEVTRWGTFVQQHFPHRPIPKTKKERARFHKEVDPILLE